MKNNNNQTKWWTNNAIPIVITLLTWAVSFGILTTKVDQVIKNQDNLIVEVREWRKQYEQRLGQLELDNKVISERQDQVRTVLKLK